jgi:hypothetical protein
MGLKSYHFYHPFKNSSFAFLAERLTDSNNITGYVLDDIDLYYQPLESPSVSFTFFTLKLISIFIGEWIGMKVLTTIKKEIGLLTEITKLFVISQMILHPIVLFFDLTINLIHPVNEVIGDWFCSVGWLTSGIGVRIVLNNSFMAALMRYFFIIHETRVKDYGKKRAKRIFLVLTFALPLFQFISQAAEGSPRSSFVKKCYGEDHKVFLIETSTLNVLKNQFLKLERYEHNGFIGSYYEIGKKMCKIIEATLFVIMGFNISEGVLYYKIFSHMHR